MIENKEEYRCKRSELSSKKDELSESIDMVDAVREMLKTYNVRRLSALKAKLEQDYEAVADEYEEFIKEENEVFDKITKEFSANQIECWFVRGWDMVDLVNAYLSGDLEKFKEKPNEH
jgi:predicted nuclease with TOPRIM domain